MGKGANSTETLAEPKCDADKALMSSAGSSTAESTKKEKMSGEEMISGSFIHPDETFWMAMTAYHIYCGDFDIVVWMCLVPTLVFSLMRFWSKPVDPEARNTIVSPTYNSGVWDAMRHGARTRQINSRARTIY